MDFLYDQVVFLSAVVIILTANHVHATKDNFTDIRKCKLSHSGVEFNGPVSDTESGIRCQYWDAQEPVHEIASGITDADFPEGSRRLAKNSCRNPTRSDKGPWCYTLDPNVAQEICAIPLCRYTECRLTGPGVEYAGTVNRSSRDGECVSWDTEHDKTPGGKGSMFPLTVFPSGSRENAKNHCRNPDGDPAGPWCYVKREGEDHEVEGRELCHIPLCDDPDCMVYTGAASTSGHFAHFTSLNASANNLTVALKLWNPEDWSRVTGRLLLSAIATPMTGKQAADWGVGVEITLSNRESGITAGGTELDLVPTVGLLTGSQWSWFSVTWTDGFISFGRSGTVRPIFTAEYQTEDTGLGLEPGPFNFYSIVGEGVTWNMPSCEQECEVHITSSHDFARFWPLRATSTGHELATHVRGRHTVTLELRASPASAHPSVRIVMDGIDNTTTVTLKQSGDSGPVQLQQVKTPDILDYWNWREFSISIFGDKLHIFWTKHVGTVTILEAQSESFRFMKWFSPSSKSSVTHWTFFCTPSEEQQVPPAVSPDCASTPTEFGYEGSQWSSSTGLPCIPWTDTSFIPLDTTENKFFPEGSKVKARNLCRNLQRDPGGPFCYAVNPDEGYKLEKQYCKPRKCRQSECRMAGTGNDYMGKLNVTRSNRTCQSWSTNSPHKVKSDYLKNDLFPDNEYRDAKNYCRDPSRNIAGSWCYTTDPTVPTDACDIRDCVMPEECTIMTRGVGLGRKVYIVPEWRTVGIRFWLKEWDPDLVDGIIFELWPLKGNRSYKLVIGAEDNEKVEMYYSDENGNEKIVKTKTLPHLIPIGKWGGFWLKVPEGRVELGYDGVETVLFEWTHTDKTEAFKAMFMNYKSIIGNTIGVSFPCSDCHVEKTDLPNFTKIFPLGLWSKSPGGSYRNITVYMRGKGIVLMPFFKLPGLGEYYAFVFGEREGTEILFIRQTKTSIKTLESNRFNNTLISEDKWTRFFIRYSEHYIGIGRDGVLIMDYRQDEPMLHYWFSLSVENGYVIWSVNCGPLDIDGPPVHGGWSEWGPWSCSVTCGGGIGTQRRTCTSPAPNIYGENCLGSDVLEGKCNDFECGDLSPDTTELVVNRLQREHFSYEVFEGQIVTLDPDEDVVARMRRESPKGTMNWTKDGLEIIYDDRIEARQEFLILHRALLSDNGVFAFTFHRVTKDRVVARVISLAVRSKNFTLTTRATLPITLKCNSIVLGYIYADLSQKWIHDSKVWKDYGITTVEAVNTEEISSSEETDSGEWKCVVSQNDLHFTWITNVVRITVKSAPTFYTHLMEDQFTAPFFSLFGTETNVKIALVVIFFSTILVSAIGVLVYLRWCRFRVPKKNRRKK